jgi:hypothetical protein
MFIGWRKKGAKVQKRIIPKLLVAGGVRALPGAFWF